MIPQLTARLGVGQFYPGSSLRVFLVFGEAVAKFVESLPNRSRHERSSIEEEPLPQEARILLGHT
jgi:hypothetical protein